ncbi:MAG TPA: DUF3352 domain-containing protein [Thermoleophilaceae bacterium]|nr:DUF3352 domain-containing protein [Thermoleophilaceae bacterium]
MRHLILTFTALSICAVGLLGCGDEQSASSATALVPAGSVFYGEATLEPEGDQRRAIDALASKLPGEGGAGERLQALIEKGLEESDAPISFEDDVEPWLGAEAAFFAAGELDGGELESTAVLVATDDEDAARDTLEKSFEGEPQARTYKDVEYLRDGEGAGAVLDGFLVVGSEGGLKAAIDTADGGAALSEDDAYSRALDEAEEDRVAHLYVNSPELYELARRGAAGLPLGGSLKKFFEEPYVATLDVDDDGVSFEAAIPESFAKAVPFFSPGSELVSELPADSWLALAQPDLGKTLDSYVTAFGDILGGREALDQQFRAFTGLDLQEDVLAWMGDFGIFVRGTSLAELDGALVVETSDPAASGRLIARLRALASSQDDSGTSVGPLSAPGGGDGFTVRDSGASQPIHLFQRNERFVIAYGDRAAADAISPAKTLGDSADYGAASESLAGYDVSFYLAVEPILQLAESAGAASDEGWQEAKPYLEPLRAMVGGTKGEGDDLRSAFKLIVP